MADWIKRGIIISVALYAAAIAVFLFSIISLAGAMPNLLAQQSLEAGVQAALSAGATFIIGLLLLLAALLAEFATSLMVIAEVINSGNSPLYKIGWSGFSFGGGLAGLVTYYFFGRKKLKGK